jgi:hypothetical protein
MAAATIGRSSKSPRAHFVIGSRKSELALWQARAVKELLERSFPTSTFEIQTELTVGDRVLDTHLSTLASASPGLFTKELETGLLVRHRVEIEYGVRKIVAFASCTVLFHLTHVVSQSRPECTTLPCIR